MTAARESAVASREPNDPRISDSNKSVAAVASSTTRRTRSESPPPPPSPVARGRIDSSVHRETGARLTRELHGGDGGLRLAPPGSRDDVLGDDA